MHSFKHFLLVFTICLFTYSNFTVAQSNKTNNKTLLWRISGNGLQQPSYLFGTMHVTIKKAFYFGDSVYHALENAQGYAAELDMDSLSSYITDNIFNDKKSKLLKDVLDKQTFDKLGKKLSKKLKIDANKITVADIKSEINKSYRKSLATGEMSSFMDAYLNNIAKKQGKWTGGIEDLEDQVGIVEDEGINLDPEYILQQSSTDEESFFKNLLNIYLSEDLKAIEDLYITYSKSFNDIYLNKRNIKMARRLDSLMQIRTMFFTMGVAHLPGELGVLQLLRHKGFIVEPVFSSKKISPDDYRFTSLETNWITTYAQDSSFSFQTPGVAKSLKNDDLPIDMFMLMDLGTNSVYYVMKSPVANLLGNNYDSILSEMVNKMSAKWGKQIESKKINFKDCNAIEAIWKTDDGMYLRNISFIKNKEVFVMLFGASLKENCFTKEVDLFYNSITILEKKFKKKTTTIVDTTFLYTAQFSGNELKNVQLPMATTEDLDNWNYVYKVYADESQSNVFIVFAKETKPGYYIPSDSSLFALYEADIAKKENFEIIRKEYKNFKGFNALEIVTKSGKPSINFKTIHIVKNNRAYTLVGANMTEDTSAVETFFQSFNVLESEPKKWNKQSTTLFTTWAPNEFVNTDSTNPNSFVSFDKSTTCSYQVFLEALEPYSYWLTDTAFLNEQIKSLQKEEDSLISSSITTINGVVTANIELATHNQYNTKKIKLLLHADTMYTVCATVSKAALSDDNINRFFNDFAIFNKPTTATTIFTDKGEKIIQDIQSSDSTLRDSASTYFYQVKFYKHHVPSLNKLLFTKFAGNQYTYYAPWILAENALIDLADSSTISLIVENYNTPKDTYNFDKADFINLLFRMKKNPWAKETAKKLLLQQPPLSGNIEVLTYNLKEECKNNPQLILKLLPLTKDSSWAYALSASVSEAIDSNYIPKKELLPYENNFIAETNRRLKIIQQLDTFNYETQYYWLFWALKSYNTITSNTVLKNALEIKHDEVVYDATRYLLENKQTVTPKALYRLAANDLFRQFLYEVMKTQKKESLFPKEFANQRKFAVSYLKTLDDEDYILDTLLFVKEKTYTYKGKKLKFYLYKCKFTDDEESFLAVAGGFNLDKSKFDIEKYVCGIFYDETYDEAIIDEQFLKFIKPYEEYNEEATEPETIE